jgi:ubiquinone/menaquinone biosynthesis C-methylase UbiE
MATSSSRSTRTSNPDVEQFDHRAATYESGWRAEFHRRVLDSVADLVAESEPSPAAVLDVGCGTGALLRELEGRLPEGIDLTGVDPAPAMLEVGRGKLRPGSRIHLEEAFAEQLPFPDGTFDLVVSTVSFHHWSDQRAGLGEAARVLRPEGRILLADHFTAGWLRVFNVLARHDMESVDDTEVMLRIAGFTVTDVVRVFTLGPLPLIRAVLAHRSA